MWSNPEFLAGLDHYRAGRHWEAHEAWEPLWRNAGDPDVRRLMQGLIQVAASMHKAQTQRDGAAAARILSRALEKLEPLPHTLCGIHVERLRSDARGCLAQLRSGSPEPRGNAASEHLIVPTIERG